MCDNSLEVRIAELEKQVAVLTYDKLKAELEVAKAAYARLRGIYDELTGDLQSIFSGPDAILPEFSSPGREIGRETIRLAKEYKNLVAKYEQLQDERNAH